MTSHSPNTLPHWLGMALLCIPLIACGAPAAEKLPADQQAHATVLLYHHVATDTPAATTISPALFERHLDYLAEHDYQVLALTEIVQQLKDGEPVPARAVAITFDDAYRSLLKSAVPALQERGWPFTIFVNTHAVDSQSGPYFSWSELGTLKTQGANLQNHSHSHAHLAFPGPDEDHAAWLERVRSDISTAQNLIREQLSTTPTLFAWPYGEHVPELDELLAELDLVGFAQQSGVLHPDMMQDSAIALPRIPFNQQNGGLERFVERLHMLPLQVAAQPRSGLRLSADHRQPEIDIVITAPPTRIAELSCYANGRPVTLTAVAQSADEYAATLVAAEPLAAGRSKINCTVPAADGHWYWWSHLSMVPHRDGRWYDF